MAHIQDRWYRQVPDESRPKKTKRVPTKLHGVGMRYKVRYLDPNGDERSRSFPDGQLKAAKDWKAQRESDLARGTYVDPKAGRKTVREFGTSWLASLDIDELSRQNMEMRFRSQVFPKLGSLGLADVKPSTIRAWDRSMQHAGLSDRYRHVLFGNVSAMFTAALDDELIAKNPFAGKSVKKPTAAHKRVVPWPEAQVWNVQRALHPRFQIVVDLGAGEGLRQGEIFGLAVDDVDFLRGVIHLRRQVKKVRNKHVFALPKYDKVRDVPLSEPVKLALAEHLRLHAPSDVSLPWELPGGKRETHRLIVPAVRGGVVDAKDFNKDRWKPALRAVGVPCGPYENGMHDLRHFFASVLLDQGESIKAVAEWLGHSDPSFTLRTYTHLMPSSSDRTRSVISGIYERRAATTPPDGLNTAQGEV